MLILDEYLTKGDKWLFDFLSSEKQDVFPNDYKLEILYTSDIYDNDSSVGKSILKLQEYLSLVDIPNFFVTIHTNNKNIAKELEQVKNIFAPSDSDITVCLIDGEFKKQIESKDSLCLYPWLHLHVNPQGVVGTCCEFNENYPLGSVINSSLEDIINNDKMRKIRLQMMSQQRPEICSACWKREDAGIVSTRKNVNKKWAKYSHLVDQTLPDGTFPDFKLRFLDFRASNICNLKCRMCSGKFSSRIAQEENALYQNSEFIDLKLSSADILNVIGFLQNNINDIDAIYFAGGEPLIMEEHYKILDLLIKHNRTDVEISYNTNLTVLKYKNLNVLDYWKLFKQVNVGASIDLFGEQADYVRSGTQYTVLEENFMTIKNYVNFSLTSIVHFLNIFNLPVLQKHWISVLQLPADSMTFQILTDPENMCLQVLPESYKQQAVIKIGAHIDWLKTVSSSEHLVISWQEVLQYMNAEDKSHLLADFFKLNNDKDQYRSENFDNVFPEFKELKLYVQNKTFNS